MYEVLMPVDSSRARGTAQAETVKSLPDAAESVAVTVLYVFADEDDAEGRSVADVPGGEEVIGRLDEADLEYVVESRIGDPASEILDVAEEIAADHLVLGGRKRSPFGSLLYGSVTQAVVLDADLPVTITGRSK